MRILDVSKPYSLGLEKTVLGRSGWVDATS